MVDNIRQIRSDVLTLADSLIDDSKDINVAYKKIDDLRAEVDQIYMSLEEETNKNNIIELERLVAEYSLIEKLIILKKDKATDEDDFRALYNHSWASKLISLIYLNPGIQHRELVKKLNLKDASVLTKRIDALEEYQVIRKDKIGGGKSVNYSLTNKGIDAYLSKSRKEENEEEEVKEKFGRSYIPILGGLVSEASYRVNYSCRRQQPYKTTTVACRAIVPERNRNRHPHGGGEAQEVRRARARIG